MIKIVMRTLRTQLSDMHIEANIVEHIQGVIDPRELIVAILDIPESAPHAPYRLCCNYPSRFHLVPHLLILERPRRVIGCVPVFTVGLNQRKYERSETRIDCNGNHPALWDNQDYLAKMSL
jgi:hypothetical protein